MFICFQFHARMEYNIRHLNRIILLAFIVGIGVFYNNNNNGKLVFRRDKKKVKENGDLIESSVNEEKQKLPKRKRETTKK